MVRPVCLRFVLKIEKKQKLTKILRLQILALYTANCDFHHKSHFSSNTPFMTKSFADSELVGLVCLRFAPKSSKKQTLTNKTQ